MSGSGSGEERTWTIYVCGLGHAHGPVEATTTCSAAGRDPVVVVEASALRAEREAREKLAEVLDDLGAHISMGGPGSETDRQVLIQAIDHALSAVPAQKEEPREPSLCDNCGHDAFECANCGTAIFAPQPEEEKP